MIEERVTEIETPTGDTHTHTTVIHDGEPARRGGGSGWVIVLLLIMALIAAIYFFSQMSGSETAKDNAVANAANDVGDAAQKAGDAVSNAADDLTTDK